MLRTWNVENINQGQRAPGGGSKVRKALGDAGPMSQNPPPPATGKGALLSDPKGSSKQQRRPLGGRSENVPTSSSSGKGGHRVSDSQPKQQQQRRALGDISNAGQGPAGAGSGNNGSKLSSGKKSASGLKFSVHSDLRRQGAVTGKVSATTGGGGGGGGGFVAKQAKVAAGVGVGVGFGEGERFVKRRAFFVEDIEVAMGRTGDEEEVVVQRRAEERAARSSNRFKSATVLSLRPRKPSLPVPVSSEGAPRIGTTSTATSNSTETENSTSTSTSTPGGSVAVCGPSPSSPPSPLLSAFGPDDDLHVTIDRRLMHDSNLEDTGIFLLTSGTKGQGEIDFLAEDLGPDWLVPTDDLNSTPLSPLGDSFLTQDLELTFK